MLTIGISTVNTNCEFLLQKLDSYLSCMPSEVSFLVVSQKEEICETTRLGDRLTLVKSTTSGLSISRNLVISHSEKKWVWFQDDDIELDVEGVRMIIEHLKKSNSDIMFIKIKSSEGDGFYKDYHFHNRHSKFNAFKISSIELLVRKEFAVNYKLNFNCDFGLGSRYPCGEENIFVHMCFKCTKNIEYLDIPACFHTTKIENRNIDFTKNYIAKGAMLRFFPSVMSVPVLVRWVTRGHFKLTRTELLRCLLKGYSSKRG